MSTFVYTYRNTRGINYILHMRKTTLRGSQKEQTLYFFAREPKQDGLSQTLSAVPDGYEVTENPRTGLPLLRKTAYKA